MPAQPDEPRWPDGGGGGRYPLEGRFAAGSTGLKIETSLNYVPHTGKEALITSPEAIHRALRCQRATWIVP